MTRHKAQGARHKRRLKVQGKAQGARQEPRHMDQGECCAFTIPLSFEDLHFDFNHLT